MGSKRRKSASDKSPVALVVSGGGARGAYQVGVLRGLLEQGFLDSESGFEIFVGSSAGALNASMLAAYADDPKKGIAALERVWGGIKPQHVFRTDLRSLGGIGAKWVLDLSFGGIRHNIGAKSLLDTTPLRKLLRDKIPFRRIDSNIEKGDLWALAIAASDLYTGNGVLFVHGNPRVELWERSRWVIERAKIGVDQLMASSAIPVFFPSVEIDGRHFGDGCIRNTTPLSPAINLDAQRIVAIGVREAGRGATVPASNEAPTIAQIAGVLLDAVMLDAIEVDVEHSGRVNRSVRAVPTQDPQNPFRVVDVLWLCPTTSFGAIAAELSDRIPRIVRYLMRGLGSDEATTELVSYLLFDSEFCGRLMEIGRQDVLAARPQIEEFFSGSTASLGSPAP